MWRRLPSLRWAGKDACPTLFPIQTVTHAFPSSEAQKSPTAQNASRADRFGQFGILVFRNLQVDEAHVYSGDRDCVGDRFEVRIDRTGGRLEVGADEIPCRLQTIGIQVKTIGQGHPIQIEWLGAGKPFREMIGGIARKQHKAGLE